MKKNIALLFFIVLFIVTLTSTIYLYSRNIMKNKEIENLNILIEEKNKNYEEEIARLKEKNQLAEELEVKFLTPTFDVSKIQNKTENIDHIVLSSETFSTTGIVARINENGKLAVKVNSENILSNYQGDNEEHEIDGIEGVVITAKVLPQGNNSLPQIVVLMQDGTVEYVDMKELSQGNFVSGGKIKDISSVARIESVQVSNKMASWFEIAVVCEDGNIYILDNLEK